MMWWEAIGEEMDRWGDYSGVIGSTLTDEQLAERFDPCDINGPTMTVWTVERVYFLSRNNKARYIESVSQIVDGKPTPYIGHCED